MARALEDHLLLPRWLQDPVLLVLPDVVSQSVLLGQLLAPALGSEAVSQAHLEASEARLASLVVAALQVDHVRSP